MTLSIVSVKCGGNGPCQSYATDTSPYIRLTDVEVNRCNGISPCEAYERLLVRSKADLLVYLHDDVTIHDLNWVRRIVRLFDNQNCIAVGFGGAVALGHPNLYKLPYQISNMARRGYASNQTDWEVHGELEKGDRRVAVLDAFCMAVRTDFLRDCGGWPTIHLTHHCLDLWLACEAARRGKEIWMAGVSCTHHGGGTSTKPAYRSAKWLRGGSLEEDHRRPHKWLYETYRDVLPLTVIGG